MQNPGPPRIHVVAKPSGATCNLDCAYCFYLEKERLHPGSKFRWTDEVLETYIRQLIEAHRTPQATVSWQGGEPTLIGIDFYRRAIELQKKNARPYKEVKVPSEAHDRGQEAREHSGLPVRGQSRITRRTR